MFSSFCSYFTKSVTRDENCICLQTCKGQMPGLTDGWTERRIDGPMDGPTVNCPKANNAIKEQKPTKTTNEKLKQQQQQ